MPSNCLGNACRIMADGELEPLKCALRFKPPTLVLLYKSLKTGKTRKRSIPLRGLTAETSLPSYTTQLLQSPRHTPYLTKIPRNQLESLLQRVQDALHPVLHTTTTPSHIHTSLIDAPPLSFTAKLQHQEKKEEEGEKRGRKSVLDENFDSALAELLGGGSDKDSEVPPPDRRGPSTNTTVQSDTAKAISEPLKTTPDPTNTNSLYGRKLPPLSSGSHDAGHGRSGDAVKATVIKTNQLDASSLVSTESSGQRGRPPLGTDGTEGVRQNAAVIQPCTSSDRPSSFLLAPGSRQKPPRVTGTFPTEVPEYSVEFSSDCEALSSPRVREGKEQSPADKSLSFPSHLSLSGSSLGLSVDQDFNHLSSDSLVGGLGGIVTGDNSHDDEEEDLNKASDEQVAKRKAEMEVLFEANRLQPGDKGYVYDKEVEFGQPKIESGWDSDDESSNDF